MQLRAWVNDKFGSTGDSLLDESLYSNEELLKDKVSLKQDRARIEKQLKKLKKERKKKLLKARDASDREKRHLAKQADMALQKMKLKRKQLEEKNLQLGTIIAIEGGRELLNMANETGDETTLSSLVSKGRVDAEDVEATIADKMTDVGVSVEVMQGVQEALDFDVVLPGLEPEMEDSQSMEIIEQLEEGAISEEQLDEMVDTEAREAAEADASPDPDLDIEEELGLGDEPF